MVAVFHQRMVENQQATTRQQPAETTPVALKTAIAAGTYVAMGSACMRAMARAERRQFLKNPWCRRRFTPQEQPILPGLGRLSPLGRHSKLVAPCPFDGYFS